MPYPEPKTADTIAQILSDMRVRIEGSQPEVAVTFENYIGLALAGTVRGLHKHLAYVADQIFPDRADAEGVLAAGRVYGVERIAAQRASGVVTGTGTAGASLPQGSEMKNAGDVIYRTVNAETANGSGQFTAVEVEAIELGTVGNIPPGTGVLKLVSGVPDVDTDFALPGFGGSPDEVDGGIDLESISDYRIRVLRRIADPPKGGANGDFVTWAKEVPGVTRAWEQENVLGFGTVRVYFVRDEDNLLLPDASEVLTVQNYLQERDGSNNVIGGKAPIFVPTTVSLLTTKDLDITIVAKRATGFTEAEGAASIEEAIDDVLFELAVPGEPLRISQIREAISTAAAEVYHTMSAPVADVTTDVDELLVRGTVDITWIA